MTTEMMNNAAQAPAAEATPVSRKDVEQSATVPTVMAPIDILETAEGFIVRADMPGVTPDQVEIEAKQGELRIAGTARFATDKALNRPSDAVRYTRSLRLGEGLDRDGIDASLKHGVLTVNLPKAREAQPRRIEVRVEN